MNPVSSKSFVFALLLAAATLPVAAQQSGKVTANDADAEALKKANAFMPPQSVFGTFHTAKPASPFDQLPGGAIPQGNSAQQNEAWRKYQENQKDWTLMTPAEILDVPTPEKILGVPDESANLSPEERYMKRLDQQAEQARAAMNPTNSTDPFKPVFSPGDGNPFAHDQTSVFRQNEMQSGTNGAAKRNGANRIWGNSVFQNPTLELEAQKLAAGNPLWDTPFAHPDVVAKPEFLKSQREQASMDRFQELLFPKAPAVPAFNQHVSTVPIDPNMQVMPAYNPNGNTFAPLQPYASRPTGLMPIPGPETRHFEATPEKPAWTPKLPPWMNKNVPGNNNNPQSPPPLTQRVF